MNDIGKQLVEDIQSHMDGHPVRPRDRARWWEVLLFVLFLLAVFTLCKLIF